MGLSESVAMNQIRTVADGLRHISHSTQVDGLVIKENEMQVS